MMRGRYDAAMITGINKVAVPVDDQQAALEFWRDKLGFVVRTDAAYGEQRWIEVASPNGAVVLTLTPRQPDDPGTAHVPAGQPTLAAMLATDDLHAAYERMTAVGVEFLTPPREFSWGAFSLFADGQGNRIALVPAGQ